MRSTLNLEALLPEAPSPVGNYLPVKQLGNLVMTSGMIPVKDGQVLYQGAIGSLANPMEEGQQAARLCCLNALSAIKAHIGDLDKIKQVVKVTGFVSSAPGFYDQPKVINGASDLLVDIFGEEKGKHIRSAVGVMNLPMDASVEIELTVEV